MPIPVSDVPAIAALVQTRAQLQARASRVARVSGLAEMAALFEGTGLEGQVLTIAQEQVAQYLANAIAGIEAQLVEAGVTFDA